MRSINYLRIIGTFMSLLIIMLPIAIAEKLTYDENGNLQYSEEDGFYRTYNSENRLWKIYNGTDDISGTLYQEFTYDLQEERVLMKKTYLSNGTVKETVIYLTKEFLRIKNDSGTHDFLYAYHEGQLIGQKNPDASKTFFHPDHLGSSHLSTDESGNAVENSSFSPYGIILSGTETSRFDYEGKEFDDVTNDYDFHFRKFNPNLMIFTQPDSLLPNIFDPQQLNRYAFERGNPYANVDPDGHLGVDPLSLSVATMVLYLILTGLAFLATVLHFREGSKQAEKARKNTPDHVIKVSDQALQEAVSKTIETPTIDVDPQSYVISVDVEEERTSALPEDVEKKIEEELLLALGVPPEDQDPKDGPQHMRGSGGGGVMQVCTTECNIHNECTTTCSPV